ncbi:MAG: N-acetyltransferase [Bacteroidetes bacterium]|nr:N-acetyltransferase [Bacteroidota bacterium]
MEIKQEEHHHAGSFYVDDDGKRLGEMRYLMRGKVMNIYHTEVDPSLAGKNMGFKLVETGVSYARQHDLKILPTCPFARKVFLRTPEFRDVMVEEAES